MRRTLKRRSRTCEQKSGMTRGNAITARSSRRRPRARSSNDASPKFLIFSISFSPFALKLLRPRAPLNNPGNSLGSLKPRNVKIPAPYYRPRTDRARTRPTKRFTSRIRPSCLQFFIKSCSLYFYFHLLRGCRCSPISPPSPTDIAASARAPDGTTRPNFQLGRASSGTNPNEISRTICCCG